MRAFGRPSCSALLRACVLLVVVATQTRCAENPPPPVATQSAAEPPPAQPADDGNERLAVAKAKVLAKELEIEEDAEGRREILGRLVEQTDALPRDPRLRMQMLFLRGVAALELNDAEIWWSTAKELRALKWSESADDAGLEILAKLYLKGWKWVEKPTWFEVVAREVDASVVTDASARARMQQTKLPWKVRDRKTGIVMLLCPPGGFYMGSPASEAGRSGDEAERRVSITQAYYISETEVTQEQWEGVMGANPSRFTGASNPVEQVSWNDCQRFCSSTGFRLPSEAEWEYACRGGTTVAYAGDLDAMAWYHGNSRGSTHAVKGKLANPWGLYDMHGNVWEWCEDRYDTRAAGTQAALGSSAFLSRVARGGGCYNVRVSVRSSSRYASAPGLTFFNIGFRVARDAF